MKGRNVLVNSEEFSNSRLNQLAIYCKIESSFLTGEGKLQLEISKHNKHILQTICKIIRESFVDKDICLLIMPMKPGVKFKFPKSARKEDLFEAGYGVW